METKTVQMSVFSQQWHKNAKFSNKHSKPIIIIVIMLEATKILAIIRRHGNRLT